MVINNHRAIEPPPCSKHRHTSVDQKSKVVLKWKKFEDRHFLDRMIALGVAAYEGQFFGGPNVVLGIFAVWGLLVLVASGILMGDVGVL